MTSVSDPVQISGIIGESPGILQVIKTATKIAQRNSVTTLITGENGTGKELVARLIHDLSVSVNFPFVDINCSAIPENLLESELFGYEKGAFTGAFTRKRGLLEIAHRGTIFLDEIGNLPLNTQSKLLKAVETKIIRRVGGVEEIKVDTRIITATNIDLLRAVKLGRFREDLYYRLKIGHVSIPPLRDRGSDVLLLASHFIDFYNEEHGRKIRGLTPAASEKLLNYAWPGNVRQLQNAMARAVLLETEDWIDAQHLSLDESDKTHAAQGKEKQVHVDNPPTHPHHFTIPTKGIALEELEKSIISSAMEKAAGNLSHAARLLKISRGKLRYRLEKLGISYE